RAVSLDPGDLVLAEQELDALGVLRDDIRLAGLHGGQVNAQVVDVNAVLRRVQAQPLDVFGGAEQRLGRNAADVDAGTAQCRVTFDAGDGKAELRGTNAGDIAARSAAEHDDVEMLGRSHAFK